MTEDDDIPDCSPTVARVMGDFMVRMSLRFRDEGRLADAEEARDRARRWFEYAARASKEK